MNISEEKPRSKQWDTMVEILDYLYPKGDSGRGRAMVFLAYTEMLLQGTEFKDGKPIKKQEHD